LSVIVVLCALIPAAAQNYTTDAILKNTTGKICDAGVFGNRPYEEGGNRNGEKNP